MIEQACLQAAVVGAILSVSPHYAAADALTYTCSTPPLDVGFAIVGAHYSGAVTCGNLFLAADIPTAPVVRWPHAETGKLYTLLMVDLDGNASGSWPDPVSPGANSPVRHWIVGNVSGEILRGSGYRESENAAGSKIITVLQAYRAPNIPVVSDRYGLYLFRQQNEIKFAVVPNDITNFDHAAFIKNYQFAAPVASNFFVAIHTSESPFSGKPFHGNKISKTWHQDYGQGKLSLAPEPPRHRAP